MSSRRAYHARPRPSSGSRSVGIPARSPDTSTIRRARDSGDGRENDPESRRPVSSPDGPSRPAMPCCSTRSQTAMHASRTRRAERGPSSSRYARLSARCSAARSCTPGRLPSVNAQHRTMPMTRVRPALGAVRDLLRSRYESAEESVTHSEQQVVFAVEMIVERQRPRAVVDFGDISHRDRHESLEPAKRSRCDVDDRVAAASAAGLGHGAGVW